MKFWPIFDIFHRLQPYLCSTRGDLGFYKQATHRRPDDEPFFYFGVHHSCLGMAQKWSILDQKWPNMAGLSTLQSGPKGPKRDQTGQPRSFWTFGTLLGPSEPFWTISSKNWFFGPKHLRQPYFVQLGSNWSQMVKKIWLTILVPFGPLWNVDKPAMLGHFWSKMDHFWAIPSHERWTPK